MSLATAAVFTLTAAAVSSVLTALGRLFSRNTEQGGAWWSSPAVALGYIAAHLVIALPAVPPVEVTDTIPWVALAGALLAAAEARFGHGRIPGRLLLVALSVGLILRPIVAGGDLTRDVVTWLVASSTVALFAWANVEALDDGPRTSDLTRVLIVVSVGAGLVLALSGSLVLGQLGLALAIALTAAWVASGFRAVPGAVPAATAVLAALIVEGYIYASVPASSSLLLAFAPATLWLTRFTPLSRLRPWAVAAIGLVLVSIPVGAAVGLAVWASPSFE